MEKDDDSKVLRWLTTFQEYEFEVEHVPGKDNFVADAFSRLCTLEFREDDDFDELTREEVKESQKNGDVQISSDD